MRFLPGRSEDQQKSKVRRKSLVVRPSSVSGAPVMPHTRFCQVPAWPSLEVFIGLSVCAVALTQGCLNGGAWPLLHKWFQFQSTGIWF